MANTFSSIGKFIKTQGLRGELIIELNPNCKVAVDELEWVLTKEEGEGEIPRHILEKKIHNRQLTVKLEGVENPETSKKLIGHSVLCRTELIHSEFPEIGAGFQVTDTIHGQLGTVDQVITSAGQIILSITHTSGKEILLPFHPDFILSINQEDKSICYHAPEGLIELYLNG